jgi:uncharacterized membrane protein
MDQLVQLLESIKLPFEVPLLLHGPVVHFAIAIPVIALLLELTNLMIKRRCVGVISGLLITLAGIVYLAAFFTGKTDGSEAYSLLSGEGKEELKEHKMLGIYLVYGIWVVLVLKLIFMAIQKFWAKALFTLILAGFVAASFIQGKHGGELVYEYGANVKAVSALDDKIMELEDEIATLKEKCKEQPAKVEAPATKPQEKAAQEAAQVKEEQTTEQKEEPQTHKEPQPATSESNATEAPSAIEQKAQEALKQLKAKHEEVTTQLQEAASEEAPNTHESTETPAAHENTETPAAHESDEAPAEPATH